MNLLMGSNHLRQGQSLIHYHYAKEVNSCCFSSLTDWVPYRKWTGKLRAQWVTRRLSILAYKASAAPYQHTRRVIHFIKSWMKLDGRVLKPIRSTTWSRTKTFCSSDRRANHYAIAPYRSGRGTRSLVCMICSHVSYHLDDSTMLHTSRDSNPCLCEVLETCCFLKLRYVCWDNQIWTDAFWIPNPAGKTWLPYIPIKTPVHFCPGLNFVWLWMYYHPIPSYTIIHKFIPARLLCRPEGKLTCMCKYVVHYMFSFKKINSRQIPLKLSVDKK